MKFVVSFLLLFLFSIPAYCEGIIDTAVYKTGITILDEAITEEQYAKAGEFFINLAEKDNSNWLPYYYASLSFNLASEKIEEPKLKDGMIDKAEKHLDTALKLNPGEPELKIMKAFIYQARIMVNPATRGLSYSSRAGSILEEALRDDPGNPRAVMLKAYNIYYTPALLRGGAANALPVFEEAKKLFSTYKPVSDISPQWGEKETIVMINTCRSETAER